MDDFLEVHEKEGIKYYVLPKGSKLYRGDNKITGIKYTFPDNRRTFFAFSHEEATEYGVVYEFETNKELHLVKIDDEENLEKLHKNASETVKKIIENNYGYGYYPSGNKRTRDSVHKEDYIFSDYLCNKGFQGYASNKVTGDIIRSNFHREVMLCDPQRHVSIKHKITPDEEEENLRNTTEQKNISLRDRMEREEKLKNKRKSRLDTSSMMSNRLFGDDEDDDDKPLQTNIKLFGGKNKQTRKYKRTNKRRKSKTSNKKTKRRRQ